MNSYSNTGNAAYAFNLIDIHDLCRVCGNSSINLNSLFDDDGSAYDFSSKINVYLPISVEKTDYLPLKICSSCANTLLSFHQLYTVCQSVNARFLSMLECDGFDQQITKQNDPSELMELQSSLSREIENEILHMNDSKDIINEIECEIAANAAAKELERIASTENISLVGIPIDPIDGNSESIEKTPNEETNGNVDKEHVIGNKSQKRKRVEKTKVPSRANEKNQPKHSEKLKNNEKRKFGQKKATKCRPLQSTKPEILKENISRSANVRNELVEKETHSVNSNCIKKESIELCKSEAIANDSINAFNCEYCLNNYDSKQILIDHIKDAHNDLIFHCEMCDEYIARDKLISHMLNHALSANNNLPTPIENNETKDDKTSTTDAKRTVVKSPKNNKQINESKENHLPSKIKRFTYCLECDKTFADAGSLRYHTDHFHNKIKNYECDICGRFFSCKRIIINHIRGFHLKDKIFPCKLCTKKFSTDSALYMHKKIHENIYKYLCQVCDRKFLSMSKLKIHLTMHTKEKNYFCHICNRGFAIRNNLTKHLLTHSKSYDFKCDKCNYVANQRRYLIDHVKRSHKDN